MVWSRMCERLLRPRRIGLVFVMSFVCMFEELDCQAMTGGLGFDMKMTPAQLAASKAFAKQQKEAAENPDLRMRPEDKEEAMQQELSKQEAEMKEAGQEFVRGVRRKYSIFEKDSGLYYRVLRAGTGKARPVDGTTCELKYTITTPRLTPGATELEESEWKVLDRGSRREPLSTGRRPSYIKGWMEALKLMVAGDYWELYVPASLAYGDGTDRIYGRGPAGLLPHEMLVCRLELVSIEGVVERTADGCVLKTKEGCDEVETMLLDEFGKKPVNELWDQIMEWKTMMDDMSKTAEEKQDIRSATDFLKRMAKAKKKGEEL
eukprot:gnl/TRDRNA2_/TRDRNA2_33858_c0_seq1.p1 gnl/TRDRNA2_/TRDRNA2_33858_c0~~gnl/TRDRNA2_/TRDRNA2_33858_c0_seq1.p1  ORF type:complete len:319 (+),score=69.03 gnl/TRDRNA2_/TRDRNA2_33858_c0_seq1:56-1012(+)